MAAADEPIVIPDEEEQEEDWPELRPQNPEEAQKYVDQVNKLFNGLMEMLHNDRKHVVSMCVNLSSLAKITDWGTFQMVLKATVRPLMQINVPEHF